MDIAGRIESLLGKCIAKLLFFLGPVNVYNEAFEETKAS
jgi:hypothetical protein